MKRFGDLAIACALIAFSLPLMAIVALLIKLDSPGPVLSHQQRLGRSGRRVVVLKFRTTAYQPERSAPPRHEHGSPTRIGQLLRYTRIDALPELLNVLQGELTLIGAGPERPEFLEWR